MQYDKKAITLLRSDLVLKTNKPQIEFFSKMLKWNDSINLNGTGNAEKEKGKTTFVDLPKW